MTGEQLRALRHAHGLTQRAMAAALGYNENYLRRLENGHEKITQRFERLALMMYPHQSKKK